MLDLFVHSNKLLCSSTKWTIRWLCSVEGRCHGHVGSEKLICIELVNCALDGGGEQ